MPKSPSLVLSFISRKGGVGKSFLAANVAVFLARFTSEPTLLLDLNLPFSGDSVLYLGAGQVPSLADLAPAIDFLTETSALSRVHQLPSGLYVLPAALRVDTAKQVTPYVVDRFLEVATTAWRNIVVDHAAGLDEIGLAALDRSSFAAVVAVPDILAINQARKTIEFICSAHFPRERLALVVNQFQAGGKIDRKIIEANVGLEILGTVGRDDAAVGASVLAGKPLAAQSGTLAGEIAEIAKGLLYASERLGSAPRHGMVSRQSWGPGAAAQSAGAGAGAGATVAGRNDLKLKIHKRLVAELSMQDIGVLKTSDPKEAAELRLRTEAALGKIIDEEAGDAIPSLAERRRVAGEVLDEALGLGPLENLLRDESVTEIMVNGPNLVFVERLGKLTRHELGFTSEDQLRRVIERIVVGVGRRVDEQSPLVDARLPDGSRVNAVIPPIALDGSKLTIRKFAKRRYTVADLLRFGTLNPQMADFLAACVAARKNIVISGGTGSGKTTLLNILSGHIPEDERIVTIEDSAELSLPQEHVARLETRPVNIEGRGEVSIRDLVRNALRMRPDRIVVGECRGGEALDMLQAMNTGHDGSLTTVHANTPRDAVARLETMCLMAGMDLPIRAIREQIASAVQVVVQQSRMQDGSRKITHVTEVVGMQDTVVTMQDLFTFEQSGVGRDGKVAGAHAATGNIPTFLEELSARGIVVNLEIFLQQRA